MEAADEEVANETIEKPGIFTEQDTEAVTQVFAGLVGDECQVRGHEKKVIPFVRYAALESMDTP